EIRGAGNLLGPQQHGYIEEVGIDLYFRLLETSIQELKGETETFLPHTKIETDLEAFLPPEYITDPRQRIEIYTKLSELKNPEEVGAVKSELEDRFGQVPAAVSNLLAIGQLRLLARNSMIESINIKPEQIIWEYSSQTGWAKEKLQKLAQRINYPVQFEGKQKLRVKVTTGKDHNFNLDWTIKLLQSRL
ncbi:MAG: hypothetical protein L0Y74_02440, partial [candidate division Zixibacteria bacterium]|nr:hypothetical protein [candidate division Zixibacteria bacterium]